MSELSVSNLFGVTGKVAIVTGGSRGIGRMIAEGYLANGAERVYITGRKAQQCETAAEARGEFGDCVPLPADLSDSADRRRFVEEIQRRETAIDILVNNAGVAWGQPFEAFTEEGYDRTVDINQKAPFFLTRDLLPQLKARASLHDPSRVINVGSIDGIWVPPQINFAYGPSKAAVHHLTRVLAVELGPHAITVNAIAPGPFETKMMQFTIDHNREKLKAGSFMDRLGEPGDMAGVALYLSSRAASYVTGVVIPVDGGVTLRPGVDSLVPE